MGRVSRCWCFVLLRALPVVTALLPSKLEDAENFNGMKSLMITEMLVKELSIHKCRVRLEDRSLRNLYFHLNESRSSAYIQSPRILSPKCVRILNLTSDLFASRMDLSLAVPSLSIRGLLSFQENVDFLRLSRYNENRQAFRLELRNLSGSGLCFTRWTERRYEVVECDIHYEKLSAKASARLTVSGYLPVEEASFASTLVEKMWRGLTHAMSRNVVVGVNALMRDLDVMKFLREPKAFQKYKSYVIESTQSANDFVDGIMGSVRKTIQEKFHDSFAIPNMEENFERKGVLITLRGSFTADHGTVRGLSTVSRVGDTAFATDNASQTHFFGNLSFQHLDLHYERYRAEFMNLWASGSLNTRLRPIRLHVHPFVNFETGRIYLEDFEIEDVGDLVVEVTGLGTVLDWIVSKITTWVAGLTRDRILERLQRKYDAYIKSVLSGYTIDDIASGRAFDGP